MRYFLAMALVLLLASAVEAQNLYWQYQPAEQIIRNTTPAWAYYSGGYAPRYYGGYRGYGGYNTGVGLGMRSSYTWGSDGTSYRTTTFDW